jgi:hypothetical protein
MGAYYLIANPDKREYLSAGPFGENIKASGLLRGLHGLAVLHLVCLDPNGRFAPLGGTWFGQRVIPTGDDTGHPDEHGIPTATADKPGRNLYRLAEEEYEDISRKTMCMLARIDVDHATAMATRAAKSSLTLIEVGTAVYELEQQAAFEAGARRLREALESVIGSTWQHKYQQACREHPTHR